MTQNPNITFGKSEGAQNLVALCVTILNILLHGRAYRLANKHQTTELNLLLAGHRANCICFWLVLLEYKKTKIHIEFDIHGTKFCDQIILFAFKRNIRSLWAFPNFTC